MTKKILVFVLFISLALPSLARAGHFTIAGEIVISPFETATACPMGVFSTVTYAPSEFSIDYGGGVEKFVDYTYPNNFMLEDAVKCTGERVAKQACIKAECENPNSTSCRKVCTNFVGPLVFSPEKMIKINGFVYDTMRVKRASMSTPEPFSITFYPFPLNTPIYLIDNTTIEVKNQERVCFTIYAGYLENSEHELSQFRLDEVLARIEPQSFVLEKVECKDTWCEGDEFNIQKVCITFKKPKERVRGKIIDEITAGDKKDKMEITFEIYPAQKQGIFQIKYMLYSILIIVLIIVFLAFWRKRKAKIYKLEQSPAPVYSAQNSNFFSL